MTTLPAYSLVRPGPLHSTLLAGTVPLFLGALLSDIAYGQTYQIQWTNFASWLIAGALVFCGFALLFALVNLVRAEHKGGRPAAYFLLLLITWVLGLVNAFQHAKDAYAMMPVGLVLSVIVTVLAIVATWVGLTNLRSGAAK
ncbi:UNVERIFIED_ORG: putative membrane protein [Pseudomonas fluorescens]